MSDNEKIRVVVAMSGGVDSSVAAALLHEQGYEVIGVSLKLWDYDEEERKISGKTCCSLTDIADAKEVCAILGIPFYAFNHKKIFIEKVIEPFVDEYVHGRTPNPCVLCNLHIKFDLLLDEAKKLGARYLATGHYARKVRGEEGGWQLLKGEDPRKDQSYFLFHLTASDLDHVLFPVGDLTKEEVRKHAERLGLPIHNKQESMEICFIPGNDHGRFIAKNYPQKIRGEGNFVDRDGNILGQHQGIERYTIGQRRGLGMGFGKRRYVSEIRPERGEVVLADDEEIYQQGAIVHSFCFHGTDYSMEFGARIRHQLYECPVIIKKHDVDAKRAEIVFLTPVRAVTPGQALVLYAGDRVIGGGWIEEPLRFSS